MKRIIIAFIIFSLCLGILGCSKSEEQLLQDHANSFLKSMKDLDLPAIYSFFDAEGEADSKAIDLKYIFEDFEDQESVESEYALRAMRSFFSMLDWEFVDFEVPDSEASDSENQVVLNYNLITPKLEYDKMIEIMERVQSKYSYLEAELSEMQADSLNDEASKRAYLEKIWPIFEDFFQETAQLDKQEIPLEFIYQKNDEQWSLSNLEEVFKVVFFKAIPGSSLINDIW